MQNWVFLTTNPEKIASVFSDDLPELFNVDLHEINMHRDAAAVTLRVDLLEYPNTPPKKWRDAGYNRVQIVLSFSGVYDLDLKGWTENCSLDLFVTSQNGRIKLSTSEGKVRIELTADFLSVDSISAYKDSKYLRVVKN